VWASALRTVSVSVKEMELELVTGSAEEAALAFD